jgi:hypothetical protein
VKNALNIYSRKYLLFKTQSLAPLSPSAIQSLGLKTKNKKVKRIKMTNTRLNSIQYARRVGKNHWINFNRPIRKKFKNIYRHLLEMEAIYKNYFKILIEKTSLLIIRNQMIDLLVSLRLLVWILTVMTGFTMNDIFYMLCFIFND